MIAACSDHAPKIPPRITAYELRAKDGAWLKSARDWIWCRCINGEQVIWGSGEALIKRGGPITVQDLEELASIIAAAAINEERGYL